VIVAADVTQAANDVRELAGMLGQAAANTGRRPKQFLADAGYYSEPNVEACADAGTDGLIATGRLKRGEEVPDAPRGRIPKDATPRQRMARKLRTKPGRAAYNRRKAIVEPVFGQMKTVQGAGRLLLRGLEPARAEWRLLAACHNLRKLWNWHVETGLMPA
jgi:IS5 family transposase